MDGRWHHAAASYNGSHVSVYYDGQFDGTTDCSSAARARQASSTPYFTLGRITSSQGRAITSGMIDELRVWSRGLTEVEITTRFNRVLREDERQHAERRTRPWHECDGRVSHSMEITGCVSCGMELPFDLSLTEGGTRGGSAKLTTLSTGGAHVCTQRIPAKLTTLSTGGAHVCTQRIPAYAAPPLRLGGGHAAVERLSGTTQDVGQRTRRRSRRGPYRY